MAQISKIQYKDIIEAKRFDAEYFKPEYLNFNSILENKKHILLNQIAFITDGIHTSIDFNERSNILLFSAKAPKENYLDISNLQCISQNQHKKNPRTSLAVGDVLISTVGTIGNIGTVTKEILPANSDRHVGIIRPYEMSSFFLSTFLNSKYGRFQSIRKSAGNVQPNLYIKDLKTFIIPNLPKTFQQEIETLVKQSHEKQNEAKNLYDEAQNLLLEELGLLDFMPKHKLSFSVSKQKIDEAKRIDSEYFQPKYDEIIEKIENYSGGYKRLSYFSKKYSTGYPFKSDSYIKNGIYLIRINNIKEGNLDLSNIINIPKKDQELSPKDIVKEDDILITMSGTIGNSCKIPHGISAVINQRIMKISPKNIDFEVLPLFINSILGESQLKRIGTGGVQTNISSKDIMDIKIPLLKQSIQEQISQKITKSKILRKESKNLLELAKTKVEQEIENGNKN